MSKAHPNGCSDREPAPVGRHENATEIRSLRRKRAALRVLLFLFAAFFAPGLGGLSADSGPVRELPDKHTTGDIIYRDGIAVQTHTVDVMEAFGPLLKPDPKSPSLSGKKKWLAGPKTKIGKTTVCLRQHLRDSEGDVLTVFIRPGKTKAYKGKVVVVDFDSPDGPETLWMILGSFDEMFAAENGAR